MDNLGGAVLGALGKKAMKEFKNNSWVSKLWGEKVDFKKRDDFEANEDYKGYVMSRVEPKMLVRCNQKSIWRSSVHLNAMDVWGILDASRALSSALSR